MVGSATKRKLCIGEQTLVSPPKVSRGVGACMRSEREIAAAVDGLGGARAHHTVRRSSCRSQRATTRGVE